MGKFADYIILIFMVFLGVSYIYGDQVVILKLEQPALGYFGWFLVLSFGSLLVLKLLFQFAPKDNGDY